jgi:hypothetical protein
MKSCFGAEWGEGFRGFAVFFRCSREWVTVSETGSFAELLGSALRAGVLSFASPKESSQRKGDPRVGPGFAGPLRYSKTAGAAELGLRPQTVLALFPLKPALLSASHGDPKGVSI